MTTRRDELPPPTAELVQLDELTAADAGRSVRVLGRIARIDAGARTLQLEYHGAQLTVDTTLVDNAALRSGDYRHFLGELQGPPLVLRARLLVVMDGVDPALYDRCLALRRRLDTRLFGR